MGFLEGVLLSIGGIAAFSFLIWRLLLRSHKEVPQSASDDLNQAYRVAGELEVLRDDTERVAARRDTGSHQPMAEPAPCPSRSAPPPPARSAASLPRLPKGWGRAKPPMAPPPAASVERKAQESGEWSRSDKLASPRSAAGGERLLFTAGYPSGMTPEQWYSLLVYLHTRDRTPTVREKLAARAKEFGSEPADTSGSVSTPVTRGTKLRLRPNIPGLVCNPEWVETMWCEDIQEADFRVCAPAALAGHPLVGAVEIYAGALMIGQIPMAIHIRSADSREEAQAATADSAMFEKIFASYSHENADIVKACAAAYKALGITLYIDSESLRSGEQWEQKLREYIRTSDVFQLYWSEDSRASVEVEKEWRVALELLGEKGDRFIRPLYWIPPPPPFPEPLRMLHAALLDLPALYRPTAAAGGDSAAGSASP